MQIFNTINIAFDQQVLIFKKNIEIILLKKNYLCLSAYQI